MKKKQEIRSYSEDEFGKYLLSELTKLNDLELIILKGHILTEFSINCYLESISQKDTPDFFKENFNYSQKVKLLSHFGSFEKLKKEKEHIIKSFEILNKIRNGIAHTLDINHQLISEFLSNLNKVLPNRGNFNDISLSTLERLESGIAFLCGIIFGGYCFNRDNKTT